MTRKQQADIVNELGSMQHLRECLDVVEIVIGFLSSNKSVASTELRTYIGRFLKMEKRFKSEKVATINCLPLYLKFSLLFLYNYNNYRLCNTALLVMYYHYGRHFQ